MKRSKPNWLQTLWHLLALLALVPNILAAAGPSAVPARERLSFDAHWLFTRSEPPGASDELTYTNIKPWMIATGDEFAKDNPPPARPPGNPGGDLACTQPNFDDSGWQQLNLPHDWAIAGPFDRAAPGTTGKLPWEGVGWYRKHFTIPAADQGRRLYLDVDGAMSYANVWLNGQYVGGWPYGYASWELDLTPYVKAGAENVLAIRLDNPPASSRWYPGAGLYRHVWLVKTAPLHVAHWGAYVTTPDISPDAATVIIQVALDNDSDYAATLSVKNEICGLTADGARGQPAASSTTDGVQIASGAVLSVETQIPVKHPKLWSLEHRQRYVVVTSIEHHGALVDRCETPFGIRNIKFDPDRGFFLNGKHVHLNGICDHADLGALGMAINERALARQIEILQAMGCNAIRTSHNPPAPELLDLCDRMGMLVMDESFDCWMTGKKENDYHLLFPDWHEKDWRAQLERDRNHPCVIMWSIGNEVVDQTKPDGPQMAGELTRIAHEEDPTRPATGAFDKTAAAFNGFQTNVDVFGYNYKPFGYALLHEAHPDLPIFGSETASCISSRGEYFFPVSTNQADGRSHYQMSSYDLYAPWWATTPDTEFRSQDQHPFVAGEFVWTGFDYLGEPGPYYDNYNDPSRSAYFGIVDLAGLKKDRFYLYQAHWRPDLPMAHLVPQCWNWPDRVGQVTPVFVYTSGDEAELFLNGQSLGRKQKGPYEYRLCWFDVKYQPGQLKAVAYRHGRKWATDVVQTTGPAAKLALQADRANISAAGRDLSFITIKVEDAHGRVVPQAANALHLAISGPGEIVAADNGDPTDLTSFLSPDRNAFNGLALAIVRATGPGTATLEVSSPGLKSGGVKIQAARP